MAKNFRYFNEFMDEVVEGNKIYIKYSSPEKTITLTADKVNTNKDDVFFLSNKKMGNVELNVKYDYNYDENFLVLTKTDNTEIVIEDINFIQTIRQSTDELGGSSKEYIRFKPIPGTTNPFDEEEEEAPDNEPDEEETPEEETPEEEIPEEETESGNDEEVTIEGIGIELERYVSNKFSNSTFRVEEDEDAANTYYIFDDNDLPSIGGSTFEVTLIYEAYGDKDTKRYKLINVDLPDFDLDDEDVDLIIDEYLHHYEDLSNSEFKSSHEKTQPQHNDDDSEGEESGFGDDDIEDTSLMDDDDIGDAVRKYVIKKYNSDKFEHQDNGDSSLLYAHDLILNTDEKTFTMLYLKKSVKRMFRKPTVAYFLMDIKIEPNHFMDKKTREYIIKTYLREFMELNQDEFDKFLVNRNFDEDDDENEDDDEDNGRNHNTDGLTPEEINKLDAYYDLVDDLDGDSPYTTLQLKQIKFKFQSILETLRNLKDGDKIFVFQAEYQDTKTELLKHFEKYSKEFGDDNKAKIYALNKVNANEFAYNTDKTESKIIFNVEIDEEEKVAEIINATRKHALRHNKKMVARISNGQTIAPEDLYLNNSELSGGITLRNNTGLFINQIIDIKKYEDISNEHANEKVTDKDILELMRTNKDLANYVFKKPSFFEYLKNGGKVSPKVKYNLLSKVSGITKGRTEGSVTLDSIISTNDPTFNLDNYGTLDVGLRLDGNFVDYGQYTTFYINHSSGNPRLIFRDLTDKNNAEASLRVGGGYFVGKYRFKIS